MHLRNTFNQLSAAAQEPPAEPSATIGCAARFFPALRSSLKAGLVWLTTGSFRLFRTALAQLGRELMLEGVAGDFFDLRFELLFDRRERELGAIELACSIRYSGSSPQPGVAWI